VLGAEDLINGHQDLTPFCNKIKRRIKWTIEKNVRNSKGLSYLAYQINKWC